MGIWTTEHQREILELTSNGYSAKEIGAMKGIASKTVSATLEKMRRRVRARNTVHLVRKMLEATR